MIAREPGISYKAGKAKLAHQRREIKVLPLTLKEGPPPGGEDPFVLLTSAFVSALGRWESNEVIVCSSHKLPCSLSWFYGFGSAEML